MMNARQLYFVASVASCIYAWAVIFSGASLGSLLGAVALYIFCIMVARYTGGVVFFFEKDRPGRFNLVYTVSIIAGALIVTGASALKSTPVIDLLAGVSGVTLSLFFFSYFMLRKHWNRVETTVSVGITSILFGGGVTLSVYILPA